jgi:hypothetical protein
MNLVNLYVMQAGSPDEDINIARVPDTHDMYRITYRPREGKTKSYEFQLHRSKVMDYIYDMLELLSMDMYPYDSIQVETKMSPAVVIPMMDLEDDSTRSLIGRTVMAALDANIAIAKRNSSAE